MELEMLKCVLACNDVPCHCSGQFPSLFSLFTGLDGFGKGRSSLDVVAFNPVASLVFPGAALWEQPRGRAGSAGTLLAAGLGGWSFIHSSGVAEVGAIPGMCLVRCQPQGTQCRGNKPGFVGCSSSQKKQSLYFTSLSR